MKVNHQSDYAQRRRGAYPDLSDQLDAFWKVIEELHTDGINLPVETVQMLNQVMAVKDTFPKPKPERKL